MGPYLGTRVPIGIFLAFWVLFGSHLFFRVPIFSDLASFTRRMSIQSACVQQWVKLIRLWWVPILAAGVSYFKAWVSLLVFATVGLRLVSFLGKISQIVTTHYVKLNLASWAETRDQPRSCWSNAGRERVFQCQVGSHLLRSWRMPW